MMTIKPITWPQAHARRFYCCCVGPSGAVDLPVCISPATAAKKDPKAFLAFAAEVAKGAEGVKDG